MNEELEKQLAKLIEKSMELAKKTGEFAIEQGGDLLVEFYRWHITKDIIYLILLSSLLTISGFFFRSKKIREWSEEHCDEIYMIYVIPFIITVFAFFRTTLDLVKIIVAPKLYIIEYFL